MQKKGYKQYFIVNRIEKQKFKKKKIFCSPLG